MRCRMKKKKSGVDSFDPRSRSLRSGVKSEDFLSRRRLVRAVKVYMHGLILESLCTPLYLSLSSYSSISNSRYFAKEIRVGQPRPDLVHLLPLMQSVEHVGNCPSDRVVQIDHRYIVRFRPVGADLVGELNYERRHKVRRRLYRKVV